MKKIFTLLFCVCAVAIAAHADTSRVEQCINIVLGVEQPSTTLAAANFDVNNDGVIDINDVTEMIRQDLATKPAPALTRPKQLIDVDAIIKDIIDDVQPTPNLGDVNKAVSKNLEEE